jgi:hypothetical protein
MQTCFDLPGVQAPAAKESFFGVVLDSRLADGTWQASERSKFDSPGIAVVPDLFR